MLHEAFMNYAATAYSGHVYATFFLWHEKLYLNIAMFILIPDMIIKKNFFYQK